MRKYFYGVAALLLALLIYVTVKDSPGTWLFMAGLGLFIYFAIGGVESRPTCRQDETYGDDDQAPGVNPNCGVIADGSNTDRLGNPR